jgi:hypothetical protein
MSAAMVVTALLCAGSASAQTATAVRCPEGRTLLGECVNPRLAEVLRHTAIVRAQPKISLNAPLNLPSEDSFYPAARDHHEERAFFGFPAERPGFNSMRP